MGGVNHGGHFVVIIIIIIISSQSVSLLHSHIDKVVNMQTKYIELDLRVYVCVR